MEQKIYKVVFGRDTLESIAEDTGYTVEEIKEWHNSRSYYHITGLHLPIEIILPDYPPKPKPVPTPEEREKSFVEKLVSGKAARYREEQTTVTKMNEVIINHINIKREFIVRRLQIEDDFFVKVELIDNVIEMFPTQLTEAINLLNDLDLIKYNVIVQVDPETGKILHVRNHDAIIKRWNQHKDELQKKYDFIRDQQAREELNNFILLAGNQIIDESKLIQDMGSKLFFDLFFDKYLVTDKELFSPYTRTFYSQLFENIKADLEIKQYIVSETEENVTIRKISNLKKKTLNPKKLEELYDKKFKPLIGYKFSEFDFTYNEGCIINTKDHWLENTEVTMVEEVKNNIQVFVNYVLKKVEM